MSFKGLTLNYKRHTWKHPFDKKFPEFELHRKQIFLFYPPNNRYSLAKKSETQDHVTAIRSPFFGMGVAADSSAPTADSHRSVAELSISDFLVCLPSLGEFNTILLFGRFTAVILHQM